MSFTSSKYQYFKLLGAFSSFCAIGATCCTNWSEIWHREVPIRTQGWESGAPKTTVLPNFVLEYQCLIRSYHLHDLNDIFRDGGVSLVVSCR